MKGNKIDDLFREGLASHKTVPPLAAWDKIESQLPKKSKKGVYFWLSVAASIVLILSFGWMAIQNSPNENGSIEESLASEIDTPEKSITEETDSPDVQKIDIEKTPELDKVDLVAENPTPVRVKKDAKQHGFKLSEKSTAPVKNKNLYAEVKGSPDTNEIIEIHPIRVDIKSAPRFFIAEQMSQNNFMKDFTVDIESYMSSYQILTGEPTKRKRFSLISGIVTVAKNVNSSKLSLSEMRKSKNDFFNNDLKYGSKEGDPEGSDDDLDEK